MSDIYSQTQTALLLGGRRELPAIFQRTGLAQGPVLLLSAGHWVLLGHSICVCTTYSRAGYTERQGWTPGRCLCGKMPWHLPKRTSGIPSKTSMPASLITPAQSVTSQWRIQQQCSPGRWVIPRFALIFAVPHKDNLTILTLPQLYLLKRMSKEAQNLIHCLHYRDTVPTAPTPKPLPTSHYRSLCPLFGY